MTIFSKYPESPTGNLLEPYEAILSKVGAVVDTERLSAWVKAEMVPYSYMKGDKIVAGDISPEILEDLSQDLLQSWFDQNLDRNGIDAILTPSA